MINSLLSRAKVKGTIGALVLKTGQLILGFVPNPFLGGKDVCLASYAKTQWLFQSS